MAYTSRKINSNGLAKDKQFYILPEYLRKKIDNITATDISKHYTTFKIPKRKSGFRTINAPDDELKEIQKDLLEKLRLIAIRLPHWISGFSPYRSIATNALEHRFIKYNSFALDTDYHNIFGKQQRFSRYCIKQITDMPIKSIRAPKSMIKMDIKNAFDSVGETLIKRGWPKKLRFVEEDFNRIIKVCLLNGCLPQGAPTSPFLLNIGLLPLDFYSRNLINRYMTSKGVFNGYNYTRYADDITVSVNKRQASELIGFILGAAKTLGLFIKKSKTRKMSRKFGMFVTGISVHNADTHITVSRKKRANIRAKIFNYHKNGGSIKDLNSIIGHIVHINSLDNGHGSALLEYAIKLGVLNKEQNIGGFPAEQRVLTGKDIRNTRFQYFTKNKITYEDNEESYEQSEQEYHSVF